MKGIRQSTELCKNKKIWIKQLPWCPSKTWGCANFNTPNSSGIVLKLEKFKTVVTDSIPRSWYSHTRQHLNLAYVEVVTYRNTEIATYADPEIFIHINIEVVT